MPGEAAGEMRIALARAGSRSSMRTQGKASSFLGCQRVAWRLSRARTALCVLSLASLEALARETSSGRRLRLGSSSTRCRRWKVSAEQHVHLDRLALEDLGLPVVLDRVPEGDRVGAGRILCLPRVGKV